MAQKAPRKSKKQRDRENALLDKVHLHAAGIDIGADEHWVAVPEDRDARPVRPFRTFTPDLEAMCNWLQVCGITTVAMESTGVYWIPLYQMLEARGLEVLLVNASHVKNVPGRKTDVQDCQWIQQLHTFGLLRGSFRPANQICEVRAYLRLRDSLTKDSGSLVLRMQKALTQMNVQIHRVLSDITGVTGMNILRAIIDGQRDGLTLAKLRHPQIKTSEETIAKSLQGDYRPEFLFELKTALELWDLYQLKMMDCDQQIRKCFEGFEAKVELPAPDLSKIRSAEKRLEEVHRHHLQIVTGSDLTLIPGLNLLSIERIISEVGLDMSRWPSEKHFCAWLGVAPRRNISGGKDLKKKPRKNANRAAAAFRIGAQSAMQSKSAVGAFIRRIKVRLGAPTAINAGAHKLAQLFYRLLKYGQTYVEVGQQTYERRFRDRVIGSLQKRAKERGFELQPVAPSMVS